MKGIRCWAIACFPRRCRLLLKTIARCKHLWHDGRCHRTLVSVSGQCTSSSSNVINVSVAAKWKRNGVAVQSNVECSDLDLQRTDSLCIVTLFSDNFVTYLRVLVTERRVRMCDTFSVLVVPSLHLTSVADYFDWGFSWFYAFLPGKWRDNASAFIIIIN
jgi:hypothetical protein